MPPDTAEDPTRDEQVVARWIEAINALDVEGALACLDSRVTFHPLRLGLDGTYRGHDGVRSWFAELARLSRRHAVILSEIARTADGMVRATGSLRYPGEPDVAPFCGNYRLSAGLIVDARHYLTDAELVEQIFGPATPPRT